MNVSNAMDSDAAGGGRSRLAVMFDLAEREADVLEEFCRNALDEVGIDGCVFLERLKEGQTFGEALGLPAEVIELLYARAHRWFMAGRLDRAEPLFRALCAADGAIADYWIGLGVCLRMRGDLKGADLTFMTAARLRPDWSVPAFHAAELALQAGDLYNAEAQLARFRALAGSDTPPRMCQEAERIDEALRVRRLGASPMEP